MRNILYEMRLESGLSLDELSKQTKISKATLHRFEMFRSGTIQVRVLKKLAEYYKKDGIEIKDTYLKQLEEYQKEKEDK